MSAAVVVPVDCPTLSPEDIADATAARVALYGDDSLGEVVVVDGFGVQVSVRRGCLELSDGVGENRRIRTITRSEAGRTVRRIVVLGVGSVTTEAASWCAAQKLPLVLAKPGSAEPFMVGAPGLFDHGGLIRAQSIAPFTAVGMRVVRWLLDERLGGQARIVGRLLGRDDLAEAIEALREPLSGAETVVDAMAVEGRASELFWPAWQSVEVRFARRDLPRVPDHWRIWSGRASQLNEGRSNRHATNVINGLLNFGYWMAQSEATIALLAVGLHPAVGLAHSSRQGRPAAALDVLETGRELVEQTVLELVKDRTLQKRNLVELASGQVNLMPPLAHEVAQVLSPALRDRFGPVVEQMAAMIAEATEAEVVVPTPLSRARHGKKPKTKAARFARHCHGCGQRMPEGLKHRSWCNECLPAARKERDLGMVGVPRRRTRPPRRDYATKRDRRRAETMTARVLEQQAWERANQGIARPDPAHFAPIREGLAEVRLDVIAATIAVSRAAASQIRRGQLVPHVRHWQPLAALARVAWPSHPADNVNIEKGASR
jgi:CRISPR-associated endonuclease Cas1